MPFVPDDFEVPAVLTTDWCRLRPLAVADNERDFGAWQSSVEHIRATPGYTHRTDWPVHEYALEQNEVDLAEHVEDWAERRGFTFTVLSLDGDETIGCVYIYPPEDGATGATDVRSWVRADHAEHDAHLYEAVSAWLAESWPFTTVTYAPR